LEWPAFGWVAGRSRLLLR